MADHPLATPEEHPVPAVIMHWVHLISLAVLIFTGFYIHWPFFPGAMGMMRNLHFVFMYVFILTAIVRVWWAFLGAGSAPLGSHERRGDYKFFGPQAENKGTIGGTIRYYTFLQKDAPPVIKYNGLQKGTYVFWLFLIAAQAITGFALWTPTARFFLPMSYALGGITYVRMFHYLGMWLFIITVAIHIYLAVMHFDEFMMMFFHREVGRGDASPSRSVPPVGGPEPSGRTP
jgi:Ni/Fe-hydrogenase 1 B-type cytochrome subunit